jgi:hypothetical protein
MNTLDELKKDFGAFYPTGYMVVGFNEPSDAKKVLQDLMEQGHKSEDGMELSPQQMIDFAERNLAETGVIANLGTSLTTVQAFLDAARQGVSFLILPTPDESAAARVSAAIHRVPFVLAERYHQLAIETVR